ncbi:MAG: hypothetical protein ACFFHD_10680 [Promethearchaeota archaeon]
MGPVFFDAIIPEIVKEYSNKITPILTTLIEYTFMIMFILYIMYPNFLLFRKSEIGYKELLLASPVRAGDIFIGEFLGQLPFYFLFILGMGPLINSILLQLNPNLTLFHNLIIYFVFFTLLILGLLIGTIIANWLEYKILIKNKSKNSGYSLLLLLSFSLIATFYFFHFLFDFVKDHPEFKNWLTFYPSFWYSNILLYLINPILIKSYFLNIWISLSLAIIVPLIIFYISYKKTNIFYNIVQKIKPYPKIIEKENNFYLYLRKIIPKRYKNLTITQFKEFFRKKDNIPKIIYVSGFTAILGIIIFFSLGRPLEQFGESWTISSFIIHIFYFDYLLMMIISWMGGMVFGIFIGIYSLISSKDIIFLYKKSVRGIKALIYSFLYEMIYIIFFLNIILTIFFSILFSLNFFSTLMYFFLYPINTIIILIQAIGIQCIKPMFNERGKNVYFNIYLIILNQIISLLLAIFIIIPLIPNFIDHSFGLLYILLTNIGISAGIAFLLLYFGIRKLNHLE